MTLTKLNFEDAQKEFKAFLAANGLEKPILWTFREDIYSRKTDKFRTDFWLKLPLPKQNQEFAKFHFELGKEKGVGLGLTAYASCEEGLCCSFVVPEDAEDGQYLLMDPEHLKYSFISRDMPTAKVIRNKLLWKIFGMLPFLFNSGNHFVYLASRAELHLLRVAESEKFNSVG